MKKTLTINLGGLVFNIDDDAFVVLKNYLDTIRGYFDTSEGRDEIMTDIESRIAEMLTEKMHGGKEVVNSNDINEVISIMGEPEDYITEDMDEEPSPKSSKTYSQSKSHSSAEPEIKRRLFRDTDSGMLGGVCAGTGHYFGVDAVWFRLALVLSVLFLGFGFLFYIILWIIMPEARTSAEKLAMKGEPVTFENIGKTVEEEMQNVKKKLNNLDGSRVQNNAKSLQKGLEKIGLFLLSIFKFAIKAIGKILGFFFILFGGIILFTLIFGTFTPLNNLFFDFGNTTAGYNMMEVSHIFFPSGFDFWFLLIGGIFLIGVPFLALVFAGFALLFGMRPPRYAGLALAGIWVFGIVLCAIGGLRTGSEFTKASSISEVIEVNESLSDTLYFDILDNQGLINKSTRSTGNLQFFKLDDGILTLDGIEVNVLSTKSKIAELEIIKGARGNSFEKADILASSIMYQTEIDSNIIKISPYFNVVEGDKWRDQEVQINLYLPSGKTIFIPKTYKYLLYDVDNYHDTYDKNMVDMYWTMTDSGLVSPKILQREQTKTLEEAIEEIEKLEVTISDGDEEHSIVIQ
ncbi:MAG: PspC domain-containing protein [Salibacteraceae bacterium]